MKTPSLSVIMSCYNDEKYIAEAIESVLNQTFSDFEFIIIDDCSSDNTKHIILDYSKKDKRIKILTNDYNLGLAASLNKGVSESKADWIARMDGDDICEPQRLDVQMSYISEGIAVIGSNVKIIDDNSLVVNNFMVPSNHSKIVSKLLNFGTGIIHPSVIFNKRIFQEVGGYNSNFRTAQDYDLWLRMLRKGRLQNVQDYLLRLRKHKDNISKKRLSEQTTNTFISFLFYKKNILKIITSEEYIILYSKIYPLLEQTGFLTLRTNLDRAAISLPFKGLVKKFLLSPYILLFLFKKSLIFNKITSFI